MVPIGDVQSRNLPEEFANPANQIITGDGPDVMADFIFTDESRLRLVVLNKIVPCGNILALELLRPL